MKMSSSKAFSIVCHAVALAVFSSCSLPDGVPTAANGTSDVIYQAGSSSPSLASIKSSGTNGSDTAGKPSKAESVVQNGRVILGNCLQQALRYNLDVSIARLDAAATRKKEDVARAEFDPTLEGTAVNFPDINGDTSFSGVMRKKFITGTDIRLEAGTVAFDTTERTRGTIASKADLALRVRQPLLKGSSLAANSAGIRMARIIAKSADAASEAQILEMLRAGESLYWTTAFAVQSLRSQQQGLSRAERVLELVNSRRDAGASTKIDVLEAEAAVAAARDAVGRSQKHYLDSVAMLWQVAGFDVREPDANLVFASLDDAKVFKGKPSPEGSYRKAFERSPTAVLLANQVQSRAIQVDKARDNLKPRLDLELNVGTGDLYSFDRITSTPTGTTSTTTGNWNVLLRFSMPWTFRAERAELQAARLELERSELARTQGLRELKRQIYETCREIESERTQLEAASYGARVNRAKWDEQFQRYQEGLVSVRDLLEAEGAYRQSEINELGARLRLILAGILLARQEGTLPERHNFVL